MYRDFLSDNLGGSSTGNSNSKPAGNKSGGNRRSFDKSRSPRPAGGDRRQSSGGSSFSRPARSGGGRPQQRTFNRPQGGGAKRGRQSGQYIDPAKYVKKASGIKVTEDYKPTNKFSDFAVVDKLHQNIAEHGYINPSPIQDQAIPHVLAGKDVIGIANTGTGKTAAFLIPLINKIHLDKSQRVLIVLPTRELATQVEDEFHAFAKQMGVYSAVCVGGTSIGRQIANLRRNPHFIIGTPGRLKDLISRKSLNLTSFQNIVLDEVDRMLDMGFVRDIKFLISYLPANRQSLFFSATINKDAEDIMHTLLRDPIKVSVRSAETSDNVDQDVVKVIDKEKKLDQLHDLLLQPDFKKVLIFGRTKYGVEKLARNLEKRGFKASSIHGDKTQSRRQFALNAFKDNKINILVATDVAARGLDISDISHVINYDVPGTYEDYVHRIGRTGRANKKGFAITFVE
jgi:superfamily II DNA/RNA helicase